jgi:hypothetical protein
MQLREWLSREGFGATAWLARAVGTRWATIYDISNGHVPKAELAKKIEIATNGVVSAAELLGLDIVVTNDADARPRHKARASRRP